MANTLTNLIPTFYAALDVVSRELTGFIPAVQRDSQVARAALNQSVLVPVTPAESAADNTPGVTAPNTGDATMDNVSVTISKSRHVPIRFNGEETMGLGNAGTYNTIFRDRVAQGMRTLVNEMEGDLAGLYAKASRAYGDAGTAPFGTAADHSDFAGVRRILEENGAPQNDLQLVLGSAAIANLRGKQSGLFKVNEAGSSDMLRDGMTDRVQGFAIRNSGQVKTHTKGTATGYDLDGNHAIGATTIAVDGSDSGTILPGDVIKWGSVDDLYVVRSATASGAADGNIVIGAPGLITAVGTGTEGVTQANYAANLAFSRSAIVLATRLPAMPAGGDAADDRLTVVDPLTGLAFEIAVYRQYLQTVYHVRLAWGYELIKPEHVAILLG